MCPSGANCRPARTADSPLDCLPSRLSPHAPTPPLERSCLFLVPCPRTCPSFAPPHRRGTNPDKLSSNYAPARPRTSRRRLVVSACLRACTDVSVPTSVSAWASPHQTQTKHIVFHSSLRYTVLVELPNQAQHYLRQPEVTNTLVIVSGPRVHPVAYGFTCLV